MKLISIGMNYAMPHETVLDILRQNEIPLSAGEKQLMIRRRIQTFPIYIIARCEVWN